MLNELLVFNYTSDQQGRHLGEWMGLRTHKDLWFWFFSV